MRALFALLVGLVVSMAFGQDIVKVEWMLNAKEELVSAGITEELRGCRGQRGETRYELAVMAYCGYDRLQQLLKRGKPNSEELSLLRRAKVHLPQLKRLAVELKRELVSMEVPWDQFMEDFNTLADRLNALPKQVVAEKGLPVEHKAYDLILEIKEAGLLVGLGPDRRGPRYYTNFEMASLVKFATANVSGWRKQLLDENRLIALAAPDDTTAIRLREENLGHHKNTSQWAAPLKTLDKLAKMFQPELESLGVDTMSLAASHQELIRYFGSFKVAKVGQTHGPFPDVPANHWAADAVETLRNAGILVGYPDHKIRG